MPVRHALLALSLLLLAAPPVRAEPCSCAQLGVLQSELRNAIALQQAFRNHIPTLRAMNTPTSQAELAAFAARSAGTRLEPVPGSADHVDYVPYGRSVYSTALGRYTDEQLCAWDSQALAAFERELRSVACDGIADALRAHEDMHLRMCRSIGFQPYYAMHGADRAEEEAQAYGAQIAVLRAEIARVFAAANPRLVMITRVRTAMPQNPVISAVVNENRGAVQVTSVGAPDTVSGRVPFTVQGSQEASVAMEGGCRVTTPMPLHLGLAGSMETDGLELAVLLRTEGTLPMTSAQCAVQGRRGMAMSLPVRVNAGTPGPLTMPLRNGAEITTDMADTPAAAIAGAGGVSMTGQGVIRLEFQNCPAR